jgi:hydrogenase nickel incorporation protein HypA/HybF
MHELGIAQEVVAIACHHAGGARVSRITVEIGRFTAVLPDALRFCFDACTEGTAADGAALEIVEVPGRGRCRRCQVDRVFDLPYGRCACGASDFEWLAGDELKVRRVEVHAHP